MGKFINIMDLRKADFLSEEKISECSRFVNKDVSQSLWKFQHFNQRASFEKSN